jgi:hypothetical protein
VATSIAPNDLLDSPPEIFWAMVEVLKEQARQQEQRRGRK